MNNFEYCSQNNNVVILTSLGQQIKVMYRTVAIVVIAFKIELYLPVQDQ